MPPGDWSDASAWEAFHQAHIAGAGPRAWGSTGSFFTARIPQLVEELVQRQCRDVWVPGCGLSPLGRALAHLGMQVVATDVSPCAVQFQRAGDGLADLTSALGPVRTGGSFAAEVHDFRTAFGLDAFDCVINGRAMQGFAAADMRLIARVHANALREGRYAYFDTQNVASGVRDVLEDALVDGGFAVPLHALNRWYRSALRETGIPHVFILGRPMIPNVGEYAGAGPRRERDTQRLDAIGVELQRRLPAELEADAARQRPDAKVALVIYSSG